MKSNQIENSESNSSSSDSDSEAFDVPVSELQNSHPDLLYQQMVEQTATFSTATSYASVARNGGGEQQTSTLSADDNLRITDPELWDAYNYLYNKPRPIIQRIVEDYVLTRSDIPPLSRTVDLANPLPGQYKTLTKKQLKERKQEIEAQQWHYLFYMIFHVVRIRTTLFK